MEEYLKQILGYLPMRFADAEANEFVEYLGNSYRENREKEKYQFAFIAFHMLNMIFIYKTKWFLKKQGNQAIISALNNQRGMNFNGLFDLSQIKEKTSLENLLQSLGFHINDVGICKNHVEIRNNCSHASGRIYYKTQAQIEHYVEEEIDFIKRIQNKLKSELKKFLQKFLEENWQQSFMSEDFKNLFEENYLSQEDLEAMSAVDLPLFKKKSNNEKNIRQKILYLISIFEIQNQIANEENLFLAELPILMFDLPEKLEVEKGGDKVEIFTNELIEEYLMPIISKFSDKDRIKAERILKL